MLTSNPSDSSQIDKEVLVDLLFDLLHDLGKYLRMPVALLPESASSQQVRAAVEQALLRTRSGPDGSCSARWIWEHFLSEIGLALPHFAGWELLRKSVENVLAWEKKLDGLHSGDREAIMADFQEVPAAIRALIVEVRGEEE